MGTIAKVTAGGATHLIASTAYATCSTGASTAAKVATIQDSQAFTLIDGITVHVYFTNSNTVANPTLNVNSTGAKAIYKFSNTAAGTTEVDSWPAGSVVSFTYNKNGASDGCWTINNFQKQTAQVNSDWNAASGVSSILNKPTIPAAQVNSNWTATTGVASILNKPSIPQTYSDVGAASAAHTHTYSDVGAASAAHVHGSITSDGKITTTGVTLANGDALVVTDSSASHAIKKTSITFDGSTTTKALTQKGTWETFLQSYTETDPTVPAWAKASTKPTYTYSEVGAASASHTHTPASIGAMSAGGVSISRKVSTGVNIADITINGTATALYAPQAGESPVYSYTLEYGAAVDSTAVLSAYNAGGIILVKDNVAPTYPIATLQEFEGNSDAIDTLTFVCFDGSKKTTYFWQSDQISINNGWRYWEENYKGISVFNYGGTYATADLINAINRNELLYCHVSLNSTDGYDLPLIYYSTDENIFSFGSARFNGSNYVVEWANWDGGWDDNGSYDLPLSGTLVVQYGSSMTWSQFENAIINHQNIIAREYDEQGNMYQYYFMSWYNPSSGNQDGSVEFTSFYSNYKNLIYWAEDEGWGTKQTTTFLTSHRTDAWYGTSSTTASTAAKVVTISGFVGSDLRAGVIVGILFTTANTAATPTLNINSTGAKTIYMGSGTINSTTNVLKWSANTMIYFMYDGTYFRYMYATAAASATQPRGANTWYGTSSTAATTQAKTSTIENFVLTKGALVTINFSTANSYDGKITLNINSTGAKDVYYNNAVTSSDNKPLWYSSSCVTFIYSGSYYYIVSINPPIVEFNPSNQKLREVVGLDPNGNDSIKIETATTSIWNALYTVQNTIQVTGTETSISASTSGSMYFASMSSLVYRSPWAEAVHSDSTGGVRVSQAGYYKVTGSLYVNATSAMAGPSNYRHGIYIFVGTASNTSSCTETISHVQLSAGNYAINVGPGLVYANAGDKIYLVYRPLGMTASFSPANKASYLLVEQMP